MKTKNVKFYICNICGNILAVINDSGVNPVCCNKDMTLLIPENQTLLNEHLISFNINQTEEYKKVTVNVGLTKPHPMNNEHHLLWTWICTNKGSHIHYYHPEDITPETAFYLEKDEDLKEIYIYCNLHSLYCQKCKSSC